MQARTQPWVTANSRAALRDANVVSKRNTRRQLPLPWAWRTEKEARKRPQSVGSVAGETTYWPMEMVLCEMVFSQGCGLDRPTGAFLGLAQRLLCRPKSVERRRRCRVGVKAGWVCRDERIIPPGVYRDESIFLAVLICPAVAGLCGVCEPVPLLRGAHGRSAASGPGRRCPPPGPRRSSRPGRAWHGRCAKRGRPPARVWRPRAWRRGSWPGCRRA